MTIASSPRNAGARTIKAPTGTSLTCKSWLTEAPLRMLMNNLDPDVAERPDELVVYGGIGRAARDWPCFEKIVECLRNLENDQTLLVQSGKPVGVFQTHADAPRVLIANSNLVPHWATWEHFHELDRKGLIMYGQMTAGSWIYIGSQGIVQGTYETFVSVGRTHFGGDLNGKWILTAALAEWAAPNRWPARWPERRCWPSSVIKLESRNELKRDTLIAGRPTLDEALEMIRTVMCTTGTPFPSACWGTRAKSFRNWSTVASGRTR